MKTIQLTKGYVAVVDDEDYERVMTAGPWHAQTYKTTDKVYALRSICKPDSGKQSSQMLHRFILGVVDRKVKIDHMNHDGLDNQRSNLRTATHQQNIRNRRKNSNNVSGFKGVSKTKKLKGWRAHIRIDGKTKSMGTFADVTDAARAYDAAAREHFGEFALTNFPLAA